MGDDEHPPLSDPKRAKSANSSDADIKPDAPVELPSSNAEELTLDEGSAASAGILSVAPGARPTPHALPIGARIAGRYEVLRVLGEGGMGTVYKAKDHALDRIVALKTVRRELMGDPAIIQRFKQELILARQVTHRNVVRIYDLGESEGIKFISMEYVDGDPLTEVLRRRGKLPPKEAADVIEKVGLALEAAHAEGVVHRDLKPGNIMQDRKGRIVVMDFGLAHSVQSSHTGRAPLVSQPTALEPGSIYHSMPGSLIGTPRYMSPEQGRRQEADARSDIYALGLILYELLTGHTPFQGQDRRGDLLNRAQGNPRTLLEVDPHLPRALGNITAKCLQQDRELRYQTVTDLLTDLQRWRKPARRPWVWAAASAAILVIAAVQLFLQRKPATPVQHPPVSVLVADFDNHTGDSVFDGTLEPALGVALEGASFITNYNRAEAHKVATELQGSAVVLDESSARLVATRENIHVIVSGTISRDSSNYNIQIRAIDPASGKQLVTAKDRARKEDVLLAVGKLAAKVRKALGDVTPESVQVAAAETFSSGSLEAAHEYALAETADLAGKWDEAIQHARKAVQLDPNLGRADVIVGVQYHNMGQPQQAEKYFQLALSKIDHMSDREKYRTRGAYYLMIREPDKAIEEFTQLAKQYPADSAAIANLALAYFYRRDMARALEEGRRAIAIYPKNVVQRSNVGLYGMYAGDFSTGIKESTAALEINRSFVPGYIGVALSQLGQGHPAEAIATYEELAKVKTDGISAAAAGLADVALYEGRISEAVKILEQGARDDLATKNSDGAANKFATLAYARLLTGSHAAALQAADQALQQSKEMGIVFFCARAYLAAKKQQKALALAKQLAARLEPDPQAYAKLIEAESAMSSGKTREALQLISDSRKSADTWTGRYDAALAYLEAGKYAEAYSELEVCLKRRGEVTALFLDESPTYHLFPPVYYYLGRAQEGLNSPAAAESYKTFLGAKSKAEADPLVADARRRAGST